MIKNDKIKYSQTALLLCVIVSAEKILGLPSASFKYGGRDFWAALAIDFLLDFVLLIPVLVGLKNNKNNMSAYEITRSAVGTVFAKVVFALLGLVFLAKFLVVFLDTLSLFFNTFVFKSNWVAFAAVALLAGVFLLSRGFKTVARLCELYFIPVVVCLVAIIAFSIKDCNFNNLIPFADDGGVNIAKTCLFSSFYFSDFIVVWLLCGDLCEGDDKKQRGRVAIGFAIGGLLATALSVVYVALFGELSHYGDVAIARVSQFNLNLLNVGRLDWILIAVLVNAVFFLLFTYMHCFVKCAETVFLRDTGRDEKSKKRCFIVACVVFAAVVVALPLFVDVRLNVTETMMYGWGKYPYIALVAVVAISFPFFAAKANRKQRSVSHIRGMAAKITEV